MIGFKSILVHASCSVFISFGIIVHVIFVTSGSSFSSFFLSGSVVQACTGIRLSHFWDTAGKVDLFFLSSLFLSFPLLHYFYAISVHLFLFSLFSFLRFLLCLLFHVHLGPLSLCLVQIADLINLSDFIHSHTGQDDGRVGLFVTNCDGKLLML